MNKRIKIKKGIWHKECDCRCNNFRRILRGNALSVFGCKNCNLGIEKVRNVILTMLDEDEEIQEYTYREEAIKTMYKERVVNPIINAMKNHLLKECKLFIINLFYFFFFKFHFTTPLFLLLFQTSQQTVSLLSLHEYIYRLSMLFHLIRLVLP